MSFSVRRRDGDDEEWRGEEGKNISLGVIDVEFCGRMFFLSPIRAKDIHWSSSFVQPLRKLK